ncbi:hypothetical protein K3H42_06510 [Aeromonas veronii]|uniref:hypothetical protein n=1 Tax=Aeromonas TaxID=642 RepID=UPI001F2F9F3D|nr:hypothetical protein [Aeromonas veronii]MCF5894775.1 hypothetical protein [Aeromonas veronii]
MKPLTEAQVMGFRCSMPPRRKNRNGIDAQQTNEARLLALHRTEVRRAIEEYHQERALRLEMEL